MTNTTKTYTVIERLNELLFKTCLLELIQLEIEPESSDYSACSFQLNSLIIKFRVAKITPKKTGQFVTLWKRNEKGITCPYHIHDDFDFFIIVAEHDAHLGLFIFPKEVLHQNKIVSDNEKEGKRGIRVYPSWDVATNKQAIKTQNWQLHYFLDLTQIDKIDLTKVKRLLNLAIN